MRQSNGYVFLFRNDLSPVGIHGVCFLGGDECRYRTVRLSDQYDCARRRTPPSRSDVTLEETRRRFNCVATTMKSDTHVCFVALLAAPLFDPTLDHGFGGMESRAALFAKALARRKDFRVSFLLNDNYVPRRRRVDNVLLVPYPNYHERICDIDYRHSKQFWHQVKRLNRFPWVKPLDLHLSAPWHWAVYRLTRTILRSDIFSPHYFAYTPPHRWIYRTLGADAYIVMGVNWLAAETVVSCRKYGRRSVICLASDGNLSPLYQAGSVVCDPAGEIGNACHYAIMNADAIIAQTERQKDLLKTRFGRDCTVIRNPIVLDDAAIPEVSPTREFALWIGRSDDFHKRPLLCLDLAARCPEIPFVMIMNRTNPQIYDEVLKRKGPNVRVIERVPPPEMPDYFRRAQVLVSTSSSAFEGCPNVFLQAGKYGTPIVSLDVDPDGTLAGRGCALLAGGDLAVLASDVRQVWRDARVATTLTTRMRAHLKQSHEIGGRVQEMATALQELVGRRGQ